MSRQKVAEILKVPRHEPFVFLETAKPDARNYRSFLFSRFQEIITFRPGDSLDGFFKDIRRCLRQGNWLCGFFSYEFGYLLEKKLASLIPDELPYPLAWLGVCRKPVVFDHRRLKPDKPDDSVDDPLSFHVFPNITHRDYVEAIGRIKNHLENGETYQVNYTFKLKSEQFVCDAGKLYLSLRKKQPTAYSAYIHTGNEDFLSFSPELFFRRDRDRIDTRPMKGTIRRGRCPEEDLRYKLRFAHDAKIQAENVMIVDLLRNDLGRIAGVKKVGVDELFTIEEYPTLYQMTSSVRARLSPRCDTPDVLNALFPSGSVTGAPKVRTMQIIRQLEKEPRGIYTGSIGYISPGGQACFNVAIRTLAVNTSKKTCEIGTGGGIVYDSIDQQEFEEAMLKAQFFLNPHQEFSLIETIRWDHNGYRFLDLHLNRLSNSCAWFGRLYDRERIITRLHQAAENFSPHKAYKVRLLWKLSGKAIVTYDILEETGEPVKVSISSTMVDPRSGFLYHKTTCRQMYESEQARARRRGFFEVIFFNQKGELTEGAMTNIFLKKHGRLFTPPVKCGLLPGVLREEFLRQSRVEEKILTRRDLLDADAMYVGNSVRGLLEARVESLPARYAEKNV